MKTTEVRTGIYAYLTGNQTANAGFAVTNRGVVVVDTLDRPARGRDLAQTIQAHSGKPVIFVINTHHHFDHVLGNQAFGAPVVAHCALAPSLAEAVARDLDSAAISARLAEHADDRWLADELQVVYPNIVFQQRIVLDLQPFYLVLQHLGGHTPDSSIVDLPEEGVLFAGDLVFEGRMPFLGQAHFGDTIQALRALEALGPRTVVPGHGAVCDSDYLARVRTYLEALRDSVVDLLARGWRKEAVLASDRLPAWWTGDRPDLFQANVGRLYDELAGVEAFGP